MNNPDWKEKYTEKDIDIEIDAFETQFRFEELMGINPSKLRNYIGNKKTTQEKASHLMQNGYSKKGYRNKHEVK